MSAAALADRLRAAGREAGLDALGFAAAEVFASTREDLSNRKAAGLHGGMQFTYRDPERSTDPRRILPGARSLVVGARSYRRAAPEPPDLRATGRVAAYAWRDHYADLRAGLTAVAEVLRADGWKARVVADDNALVDREAAVRAGLGWYGKNSTVLLPGAGSEFVLGSVVTDAELPVTDEPVADGCGPCRRCVDACPTGAIVAPGVIDARRCLAWLVQAPGDFPDAFREALDDRIYGCDDCQDVCPVNRRSAAAGSPPLEGDAQPRVDLIALLRADDETLLADHGRWYIPERDPRYLRRNALLALGNRGGRDDPEVRAVLAEYREGDDDLLARHAAWALDRLDPRVGTG
ncbi:MAG: tRNA epoxyqueuosine(34) reductase QueG [Acidimicrobiales bacterium]